MPLEHAISAGFVKKMKRKAPAPHDWEIAITEEGINQLSSPTPPPQPKALTEANANLAKFQGDNTAANEEREKAMQQMREWGIAS